MVGYTINRSYCLGLDDIKNSKPIKIFFFT